MLQATKSFVKHSVIRWKLRRESQQSPEGANGFLDPNYWGCAAGESGELLIDGVSARELVSKYGTPLHVLNEKQLLKTYREFIGSFKSVYPNVILGTSYKTNPVPHVLKLLHEAGSYAEVISHFELWLALKLGMPPEKIIVNGPGKGDAALRLAVEKGVRIINVDGPGEIPKIAALAREFGIRQPVGLRVTSSVGWSSQFGLPIATGAAEAAFKEMLKYPELVPSGLHLHLGTGIQNIETYVQAVGELVDFSDALRARHDIAIDYFDLGGGFGVPTVRGMDQWDLRMQTMGYPMRLANPHALPKPLDYAKALSPLFERMKAMADADGNIPVVVMEPGRAITSSAQVLLLSVIGLKPGLDGKTYLILDGGKNITMPLAWETHQIFIANRMNEEPAQRCDVFGPLCHPGDIIVKNQRFPELVEGDLVAIMDAGAYFIPNQMNFSNPRPPVVAVRNGGHELVRRREEFDDIVRVDRFED